MVNDIQIKTFNWCDVYSRQEKYIQGFFVCLFFLRKTFQWIGWWQKSDIWNKSICEATLDSTRTKWENMFFYDLSDPIFEKQHLIINVVKTQCCLFSVSQGLQMKKTPPCFWKSHKKTETNNEFVCLWLLLLPPPVCGSQPQARLFPPKMWIFKNFSFLFTKGQIIC